MIMTCYDDDDDGDDVDNNGGCNSLEYMKVLFELRSEAQRGFDHRSLWELLRERERKATQVQTSLSLLLKYGSQFASNRTN